ncbi:hypothetical protein FOZ63_033882 [Perkinsus olseni]|uniref:L-type lectin-like domain-containing protein n=1 Tax=Perkinsus olseni TaxID=32597 RepID=A0A7J6TFT0_PEROL|nr:hypothetical protein FOZ63_033882 [Perkinsus olseni]
MLYFRQLLRRRSKYKHDPRSFGVRRSESAAALKLTYDLFSDDVADEVVAAMREADVWVVQECVRRPSQYKSPILQSELDSRLIQALMEGWGKKLGSFSGHQVKSVEEAAIAFMNADDDYSGLLRHTACVVAAGSDINWSFVADDGPAYVGFIDFSMEVGMRRAMLSPAEDVGTSSAISELVGEALITLGLEGHAHSLQRSADPRAEHTGRQYRSRLGALRRCLADGQESAAVAETISLLASYVSIENSQAAEAPSALTQDPHKFLHLIIRMLNPKQLIAAPPLLLLLLADVVSGQVQLESHSFTQALDPAVFNQRWESMGTCILENNHIVLTPRTADKFGALWHKSPLRTDNFEATFTLDLMNPPDGSDPKHEQGFAFWYVYDDPKTQYSREALHCKDRCTAILENAGFGLMGYKSNFNGMAIFFPNNRFVDGRMDLQPSASLAMNDGTLVYNRQVDLPTGYGSFWDYRNRRLTVQVRVQPESVTVQGRFSDTDPWTLLLNYQVTDPKFRIRPNGYIGITSLVAPVGGQIINLVDYVALDSLYVFNHDLSQKGEDAETAPEPSDVESRPDPIGEKAVDSEFEGFSDIFSERLEANRV